MDKDQEMKNKKRLQFEVEKSRIIMLDSMKPMGGISYG